MFVTRFRYLENTGYPTSWDTTEFSRYREDRLSDLPPDLKSMVAPERFMLDSPGTFWYSRFQSLGVNADKIDLQLTGRWDDKRYLFEYVKIKRVAASVSLLFAPEFIVQELTVLRNGWLRHIWSDFGGAKYEIVCERMHFLEAPFTRN